MSAAPPLVVDPATLLHDVRHEVWVGREIPAAEVPARVDVVRDRLRADGWRELSADDPDPDAERRLGRVHDPGLLRFLATAHARWLEGPYVAEVGQDRVVPYLFATPAMSEGLPWSVPVSVHAEAGRYAYDTMTLVGEGTWEAVRAAVACADTAARLVAEGEPLAFALSRPPGHHATRSGYGGSCYLNNAAVAAQVLRDGGRRRVAVLDVDAHQGNGTASIFYDRADVLYGSVHVDPAAGWFPHVVGHAHETGAGAGAGATRNVPLAPGAGDEQWTAAVADLVSWIGDAGCDGLVVSLGVDAAADDPESPLQVTEAGYREAGRLAATLGVGTVCVLEGGYHLPTLGGLVSAHLDGHRPPR